MNVYIFPSLTMRNIHIGVERKMWAVAPISEPHATARRTRALNMPLGIAGLFYCSEDGFKCFTVPFIVESEPLDKAVPDVWPETWYLPFRIRPLGSIQHRVTLAHARATWPILHGAENPTWVLTLSGAMAFASTFFPRAEWDIVLEQLHLDPEQLEDVFQ